MSRPNGPRQKKNCIRAPTQAVSREAWGLDFVRETKCSRLRLLLTAVDSLLRRLHVRLRCA
jgi:hypothetical protein